MGAATLTDLGGGFVTIDTGRVGAPVKVYGLIREGPSLFLLETCDGELYEVDVAKGRCTCPGWKYAKVGARTCKHVEALRRYAREVLDLPTQAECQAAYWSEEWSTFDR